MAIAYVTTGPWGAGTGTPNSAAQVDGNFHDVDQRIIDLTADVVEGKRIESISYTSNSMTFHFTDGTTEVIPLPVATLMLVGEWLNSTAYTRGNMVTVKGQGIFQVLAEHITPPPPATFDGNATASDGTTRLYQLWMPLIDTTYDAMIFMPGPIQRDPGELLFQGVADRALQLPRDNSAPHAYLDVGTAATGDTDIVLSIEKNEVEVGTVTFAAGGTLDSGGGQAGVFSIPADVNFVVGDRYTLRVTQSDDLHASDLSVTLPFVRMDI